MEKSLESSFSTSFLDSLVLFFRKSAKCLGHLSLIYIFVCLSALSFCTDGSWSRSACQSGKPLEEGNLRSSDSVQLQLLEGLHSIHSCQAACCQTPACDAFWLMGTICIQVNCTKSHKCQEIRTDMVDPIMVFVTKSDLDVVDSQPAKERQAHLPKWLNWKESRQSKPRIQRSFKELPAHALHLGNVRGNPLKRDLDSSIGSSINHPAPSEALDRIPTQKDITELQSSRPEANLSENHTKIEKTFLPNNDSKELKPQSPSSSNSDNINSEHDLGGSGSLGAPTGISTPYPSSATIFPSPVGNSEKSRSPNNVSIQTFSLEKTIPTSNSLLRKDLGKVPQVIPVPTGIPINGSVTAVLTDPAMVPSTPAPTPGKSKLSSLNILNQVPNSGFS
uniref:MANSC domain-containing protein n=1 Tax=Micrurus surinamensis TaxID=129470 RepID=A0A2D4PHI7_MICSU